MQTHGGTYYLFNEQRLVGMGGGEGVVHSLAKLHIYNAQSTTDGGKEERRAKHIR